MTILNSQISILILNLNGLNATIKDTDMQTEQKVKTQKVGTLYPDPSHKQGHTKTQNKRLEEDSPVKWREKKKIGVVTSSLTK